MQGKIIKGIGGFYYVDCEDRNIYECRAKGIFRNTNIKPLVGDIVEISILDHDNRIGNVDKIFERKNELRRPPIANVDQVIIVFSVARPDPNFILLDKLIVALEKKGVDICIVFNKIDIKEHEAYSKRLNAYKNINYRILTTSAINNIGVSNLKDILYGKTTVFAGPSGVGKSTILNLIQSQVKLGVGTVSDKIGRGKHTTRHATLISVDDNNTYLVDTPGFTSFSIDEIEPDDLKIYFKEFDNYFGKCKFKGCNHISEPNCTVKEAVTNGQINIDRYNNYKYLYNELKDINKY